ncbi:hypothetical protein D9611_009877 [Ephemerocybe angulata]|uniref:G domain-containing protein n=1 Tax=Ephemerocybe angulata TaxID=980116 RepID=A0A8H5CCP5_9AGAR|nr:hypothetical protein D9611_009877 [Tulosesus angulatus]
MIGAILAYRGVLSTLRILGPTGVGKSTFIRNVLSGVDATHSQMPDIGEGSTACTQKITHYVVDLPSRGVAGTRAGGRRLILVDTPGLDSHGTPEHSFELLRSITVWLASLHHDKLKLGAIIYMYPIYPGRITRNELAIFRVFKKICGTQNLARVITITTKFLDTE